MFEMHPLRNVVSNTLLFTVAPPLCNGAAETVSQLPEAQTGEPQKGSGEASL